MTGKLNAVKFKLKGEEIQGPKLTNRRTNSGNSAPNKPSPKHGDTAVRDQHKKLPGDGTDAVLRLAEIVKDKSLVCPDCGENQDTEVKLRKHVSQGTCGDSLYCDKRFGDFSERRSHPIELHQ